MKSLLLKNEKKIYFKKDYLEHINKNVYRSESLIEGKIFKITKSHIYIFSKVFFSLLLVLCQTLILSYRKS